MTSLHHKAPSVVYRLQLAVKLIRCIKMISYDLMLGTNLHSQSYGIKLVKYSHNRSSSNRNINLYSLRGIGKITGAY